MMTSDDDDVLMMMMMTCDDDEFPDDGKMGVVGRTMKYTTSKTIHANTTAKGGEKKVPSHWGIPFTSCPTTGTEDATFQVLSHPAARGCVCTHALVGGGCHSQVLHTATTPPHTTHFTSRKEQHNKGAPTPSLCHTTAPLHEEHNQRSTSHAGCMHVHMHIHTYRQV